jgi:hypothetical protein
MKNNRRVFNSLMFFACAVPALAQTRGDREEIEVEAAANATTYVRLRLVNGSAPSAGQPGQPLLITPAAPDAGQQIKLEAERQQREAQIRQLDLEITGLQQQQVLAQGLLGPG